MSSSKLNRTHINSYNTNQLQQEIIHPTQPHNTNNNTNTDQPHSVDKIQFKSTNRSSHHEVSADNFRIRYYMNLNLVKQPQHMAMQYRSSSLPHEHQSVSSHQHPQPSSVSIPTDQSPYDRSRKSIERKQQHDTIHQTIKKKSNINTKTIHIIRKTRSQNNTPPRHYTSLLRKHHKKSRLARLRSRSDGMLSFQGKSKSISVDSVEDDDDNDSVSTTDSVNNHHLNTAMPIHINNDISMASNLTPPGTSKIIDTNIKYPSSRTPPGNVSSINSNTNCTITHRNRFESEPIKYHTQPQSIAVRRSKPLSIHKHHKMNYKPRFDDFHDAPNSYQVSSPELLFDNVNTDYLVDDEANFEMD